MLLLPRAVRVLLAAQPVDLRNSIDGLAALVRTGWGENVYAGHLFVFVSRRRDRVKILSWDSGGFVVFYKRLEQGRFRLPSFHEGALGAQLDSTQLAMLLDGIELSGVRRPKKWNPQAGDRQTEGNLIFPGRWQSARRTHTRASGKTGLRRSRRKSRG
jgi:transposase